MIFFSILRVEKEQIRILKQSGDVEECHNCLRRGKFDQDELDPYNPPFAYFSTIIFCVCVILIARINFAVKFPEFWANVLSLGAATTRARSVFIEITYQE